MLRKIEFVFAFLFTFVFVFAFVFVFGVIWCGGRQRARAKLLHSRSSSVANSCYCTNPPREPFSLLKPAHSAKKQRSLLQNTKALLQNTRANQWIPASSVYLLFWNSDQKAEWQSFKNARFTRSYRSFMKRSFCWQALSGRMSPKCSSNFHLPADMETARWYGIPTLPANLRYRIRDLID